MWLGCEKLVYPEWVNYLLEQKPLLTLGLDRDFFRVASAFIELGLGFMLIIGLFGRSLSVTITLVFFLTTMVFGKVEIIGHTLIHAALIVFLLEGPGHGFRPPAALHRTLGMHAGVCRGELYNRHVCHALGIHRIGRARSRREQWHRWTTSMRCTKCPPASRRPRCNWKSSPIRRKAGIFTW